MRELPAGPVFTIAEAREVGWTSSALRNAVQQGRIRRVRCGVYAPASAAGPLIDALAAVRNYPEAVVSHRSATLVHGLPLLGPQPPIAEVTVRPAGNANLPSVHVHRARLRPDDIVLVDGTAVTAPARTVVDLARHRAVGTSVAAIDAALHRGLTNLDELADVLQFCSNWPGIRRAHRAVRLADGRAESPLESVSRLVIAWLKLPPPEPQKWIRDPSGHKLGRLDFYWDELGVGGEADGRAKYTDNDVLTAEKDRQEAIEDLNMPIARWGWRHITTQRYVLRTKIESAFQRARNRDLASLPRLWTL
jgi:predicted transcriptional regulator of viral defense system